MPAVLPWASEMTRVLGCSVLLVTAAAAQIYTIETIAGSGDGVGDDGPAISAKLTEPTGVAVDAAGNVHIADQHNHRVRKVDTSGTISTFAGTRDYGFSRDGRAAAFLCFAAQNDDTTSAVDVKKAIEVGNQFKSRSRFLEKGLKGNKVQLASAWAMDGISKYVTFFTDFEAIASAAAQARQEMRPFTEADAKKLPLTGLLYAHVEVHGRGMLPTRKVAKRYARNSAHLVVQFGEDVVQPLSKELKDVRDASVKLPIALFTWWDIGNVSLLTGGTLGFEGAKVELEFVFGLSPEQMKKKGKVILIDGDGNRHQKDVNFSKVLR